MAPKTGPRPSRTALGGRSENSLKNYPKWSPNGSHNGAQMGAKIDEKRYPKTGSTPRGVPGRLREPSGTILGAIFEYFWVCFCVFPCVFYSFHVKFNVFQRVFDVLSLSF